MSKGGEPMESRGRKKKLPEDVTEQKEKANTGVKPQKKKHRTNDDELLPLSSDVIFKLVFGDARYIAIIRAFLLSTLDIPAEEYEDLEIIDPHLERDRPDDKLGIIDVRLQLKNGKIISVEIQVRETPAMAERVAFSTGRNLARQIAPGQGYAQIQKVITIVIANYEMINEDDSYHHIFRLYDAKTHILFTSIMEIHTLELKKLPDGPGTDDKETELLNWLRLIRSERREEIEMLATQTPEMKMAVGRLKQLSSDERTRLLYESRELALMDEMARTEAAVAKAVAEEKAKTETALAKAETALAEEKAKTDAVIAKTVRNMLANNIDHETIARVSGLSVEEIKAFKE
jgi:predicted transposase/invertase (TIGR01784 family)